MSLWPMAGPGLARGGRGGGGAGPRSVQALPRRTGRALKAPPRRRAGGGASPPGHAPGHALRLS